MVVKFRNTTCPPPPLLSLHRRAALSIAIQTAHGPYIAERTQKAVYTLQYTGIVRVYGQYSTGTGTLEQKRLSDRLMVYKANNTEPAPKSNL
jgi:hypothetical protein